MSVRFLFTFRCYLGHGLLSCTCKVDGAILFAIIDCEVHVEYTICILSYKGALALGVRATMIESNVRFRTHDIIQNIDSECTIHCFVHMIWNKQPAAFH